jgi:CRISPR/Cas system-associated exonuclease Cas4 (RecB family)
MTVMYEKVNILAPMLDQAMSQRVVTWPTYDGKFLNRADFVSSSEVGKCARQIWFSKNLPPVEGMFKWGFAQRGHGHEAWVVEKLRTLDNEFEYMHVGDEQVSFHAGYQSGTPDGVFVKGISQWWLFEHKSYDPRSKVSNFPKPEHIKQTVQNMDLVEECLGVTFDGALLVYSNASDFSLTYEFWIDRRSPEVGEMMMALETRAEAIMKATSADEVEPEGLHTGGCKLCAYGSQCSAAMTASKNERDRYDKIARHGSKFFG